MHTVLQVLIHFFRKVESGRLLRVDEKQLVAELNQFGLSLPELEKTLARIARLVESEAEPRLDELYYELQPYYGTRIFTPEECRRISKKSRGFLVNLSNMGVLSPIAYENVIDQLMQLDDEALISHTKWITFQTLFQNAPPEHIAYLEWLLFGRPLDTH